MTTRAACLAATFILLSLFDPSSASAQTTAAWRGFADVGVAADMDADTYASDTDGAPALAAAIGATSTRRWTVRFETSVPAWHSATTYLAYTRQSGTGPRASVVESGIGQHRITTFSFLAGRSLPLGSRVSLALLGGVGGGIHQDRERGTEVVTASDGTVRTMPNDSDFSENVLSLQTGADVEIALSRRIAVVPQVRFHLALAEQAYARIARPAVAFRWRF